MQNEAYSMWNEGFARAFLRDSNRIEGIAAPPTKPQIMAFMRFTHLDVLHVDTIEAYTKTVQPNAKLRIAPGCNVTVGKHVPPAGGQAVLYSLQNLLETLNENKERLCPWVWHGWYESLHPFTDGNGRSGRAIYAWHCLQSNKHRFMELGFLHDAYYRALDATRMFGES